MKILLQSPGTRGSLLAGADLGQGEHSAHEDSEVGEPWGPHPGTAVAQSEGYL